MTKLQYAGLIVVFGTASFFGGWVGNFGPAPAAAQTRVQNQDYLVVPNGGLRLMSEQGRPLGVIGDRNGNGVLILFDAAGQPSVTLSAGPAGRVVLSGETNAAVTLSTPGNERSASMTVAGPIAQLAFLRNGQPGSSIADSPTGGRLSIGSRAARPSAELFAGNGAGQLNINNDAGTNLMQLLISDAAGRLEIKDPATNSAFSVLGRGQASIRRGDEVVWKVPAD